MRIEEEIKLDYSDVLFRPKRSTLSSRKDVDLKRTYKFKYSNSEWSGIPIMAANMDGVGELGVAEKMSEYDMITCLTKQHDLKKLNQYKKIKSIYKNIALSVGIKKEDFDMLDKLLKEFNFIKFICIDVANGYSERFSKFIKSVREKYPTKTIIAGNVVTADMTQELILSGADIVKVGIGPGSVCTTRIQTGVGYPQLSAVIECADAAHGLGAHIIADGGCTCPGDVAKGFGAGADFVMLGGMLAGHDEGKGKVVKTNGNKYIEFYGSSSLTANKKHYGGLSDYRSSEGRVVRVKYRGKIKDTISNILGGIRSSCTYVGAPSLKQLSKCTTFVRVSNQFNDTFVK
ncbi:MAG: GMP reductase [Pelagibacteraceae bacterium TMED268]|nr:MAG: GMP reductase [Pelagibacteraceae bacterium TMED268]|tara:strand:- start:42 stop:1076 length:1035 start_codon:yes stop_codon:yes gene_type:complete